jgi:transcriptional regulator with XRE-family HTH domain
MGGKTPKAQQFAWMNPPRRPSKHTPVLVKASASRFGERLVTARKLRQMTQHQLAHLSDVSQSTLRSLEGGSDGVSLGNLLKVLQGLDLLEQFEGLVEAGRDPEAVKFAVRQVGGR